MAGKRKAASSLKRKRERPGDYVGFRSPPALKQKLEKVAATAGRSLSSEAQFRLERSFERDGLLTEALDLAFGKPIAGLLLLLGIGMQQAALRQSHRTSTGRILPGDEILEPEARREALLAAKLLIERCALDNLTIGAGRSTLGEVAAGALIGWLDRGAPPDNSQLAEIRQRLAPLLEEQPK